MLQGSEQASLAEELGFALQFTDFSSYLQSFLSISVTSYKADCPPTIIFHDTRWGKKRVQFCMCCSSGLETSVPSLGAGFFCDRTSPKYLPQLPNG